MGTAWPEGDPTCFAGDVDVCVVPDGQYLEEGFEEDMAIYQLLLRAILLAQGVEPSDDPMAATGRLP